MLKETGASASGESLRIGLREASKRLKFASHKATCNRFTHHAEWPTEESRVVRGAQTINARIRAKVEHPSRVIKQQFEFTKVRYKGLAKNTGQIVTLFALANLWMARKKMLALQA